MGMTLLVPVTAQAAPLPAKATPVTAYEPVTVPAPARHESIGLPVIDPMALLEAFARLSPVIGGPISFTLRRSHPELGSEQTAGPSDVVAMAERFDAAGLGLADLSAIGCRGRGSQVRFDVDTRRIELDGPESLVAWALPVIDRLLSTSPLTVTVRPVGQRTALTIANLGSEAWLVTEVRLAEGPTQRLSAPITGRLKPVRDGWQILPGRLQVSLDTEYYGLLPPGVTRTFELDTAVPPGPTCAVSLVSYKLADPSVLGGLFLQHRGANTFQAAQPPWDQWQVNKLLMLGAWPPALVVVRQCGVGPTAVGAGHP